MLMQHPHAVFMQQTNKLLAFIRAVVNTIRDCPSLEWDFTVELWDKTLCHYWDWSYSTQTSAFAKDPQEVDNNIVLDLRAALVEVLEHVKKDALKRGRDPKDHELYMMHMEILSDIAGVLYIQHAPRRDHRSQTEILNGMIR